MKKTLACASGFEELALRDTLACFEQNGTFSKLREEPDESTIRIYASDSTSAAVLGVYVAVAADL
jgi:hypothetical protein